MMKFVARMEHDYTSGNSEMGRRMQSNLQKLVAAGKVNLEALSRFQDDPNLGPYNPAADHNHVVAM